MRKFIAGLAIGTVLTGFASTAAYSYPQQVSAAFQDGQVLLSESLEDLRHAVNGLLSLVDGSGNVLPSRVATGSTARFVTDAQVASWDAKYDSGSSIPYARIATGSSAMFVSSAEKSAWNSKLDASAVGVSAASLSGGLVPLAQLPPVFDPSGLNVLAASVATNAGARFVSDAEKASWDAKLGASSTIPAANVVTGSTARFVTDAQVSSWSSKLGASDLGATVAPLSGGTVPPQYLPGAFTVASQSEAEAGTDNAKTMTALRVAQALAANKATQAEISAGSSTGHYVTANDLNRYAVGTVGVNELVEYQLLYLAGMTITHTSYHKYMERAVGVSGTFRFRTRMYTYGSSCVRIYKNDAPFGPEHCVNGQQIVSTFNDDLAVQAGDVIQLYAYGTVGGTLDNSISDFKVVTSYTPAEIRVIRSSF